MIKLKDILLEIGEGVTPYEFRGGLSKTYKNGDKEYVYKEYVYKFETPSLSYDVDILVQPLIEDDNANDWDRFVDPGTIPSELMKYIKSPESAKIADVSFSTEGGGPSFEVNDYQELFRVMSTIVATLKDLIEKETDIKIIQYTAIKAEKEKDKVPVNKRDKLYQAYIKKQIPNAKVVMEFGATYIVLP